MCDFVSCRLVIDLKQCSLCTLQMFSGPVTAFFCVVHLTHVAWWLAEFLCHLCFGLLQHQCCFAVACGLDFVLLGSGCQVWGLCLNLKWVLSKAFKVCVVFLPLRITFLLEKSRDGIKGKELIFFFVCFDSSACWNGAEGKHCVSVWDPEKI